VRIQQFSVEEAIASLRSTPQGLSSAEARRRLLEYGPNRMERIAAEPLALRFLKEFTHFFALILWAAAALAFLGEWSAPGEGMAKVGYAIVAVIIVSGIFSFWQEYRVERILAELQKLLPRQVKVQRDGSLTQLPAEEVVPGDLLTLEQGDSVPADCRLVEVFGVRVNNATITGESLPRSCDAAPSAEHELIRSRNVLLAGTSMVAGQARALAFATGMHSEFGKIARLAQTVEKETSPLRVELARLSRVIAALAVAIGVLFFGVGLAIGIPVWKDFIFSIGIIVAMVPEGLLPTVTLALVLATQRMAKRNALIRYLPSVEALGAATVICTDKTGTLTQNRMTVKQLLLGDALVSPEVFLQQRELLERNRPFFTIARRCHDLREGRERGEPALRGDPMETALASMALQALPPEAAQGTKVDEIPFDAERMRLSIVFAQPQGRTLYCKGAPEAILPLCDRILLAGEAQALDAVRTRRIHATVAQMAERGLRVLALAYRPLEASVRRQELEQHLIFAGLAGLEDPPRPEVPQAVRRCRAAGIRVIMVTGDHPLTAAAIAREIGLVGEHPHVLTGEQLNALSDTQLRIALDAPEIIFARVAADQKSRIVEALKRKRHVVAVTGDGVNDAPALKSAHVGIAMGISGTDVAKEAADVVLLDDNFASIVSAVEEGRAVFDNIRKFLTYILAHNAAELVPYLGFALFTIPLPLTPIQILAIDMGTDSLTALGLGTERAGPGVMQRPPRSHDERLMNWSLALRAYLFLGLIEAAAAMAAFFFILRGAGWRYGEALAADSAVYLQATTACLTAIVAMQVVNVFLCRSRVRSALSAGLGGNRLILWGVLLEVSLILLIDYVPAANRLFGTAPLGGDVWLFLVPFALALLALEELRKWFARRMLAGQATP